MTQTVLPTRNRNLPWASFQRAGFQHGLQTAHGLKPDLCGEPNPHPPGDSITLFRPTPYPGPRLQGVVGLRFGKALDGAQLDQWGTVVNTLLGQGLGVTHRAMILPVFSAPGEGPMGTWHDVGEFMPLAHKLYGTNTALFLPEGELTDLNNTSPFSSSVFALNRFFIHWPSVVKDLGLLTDQEVKDWVQFKPETLRSGEAAWVDYQQAKALGDPLIEKAYVRFKSKLVDSEPLRKAFVSFYNQNQYWLDRLGLFEGFAKAHGNNRHWRDWGVDADAFKYRSPLDPPDELMESRKKAIFTQYSGLLIQGNTVQVRLEMPPDRDPIGQFVFAQFLANEQRQALYHTLTAQGLQNIVDLQVGFDMDSPDAWAFRDAMSELPDGTPYTLGVNDANESWGLSMMGIDDMRDRRRHYEGKISQLLNESGGVPDAHAGTVADLRRAIENDPVRIYLKERIKRVLRYSDGFRLDAAWALVYPKAYEGRDKGKNHFRNWSQEALKILDEGMEAAAREKAAATGKPVDEIFEKTKALTVLEATNVYWSMPTSWRDQVPTVYDVFRNAGYDESYVKSMYWIPDSEDPRKANEYADPKSWFFVGTHDDPTPNRPPFVKWKNTQDPYFTPTLFQQLFKGPRWNDEGFHVGPQKVGMTMVDALGLHDDQGEPVRINNPAVSADQRRFNWRIRIPGESAQESLNRLYTQLENGWGMNLGDILPSTLGALNNVTHMTLKGFGAEPLRRFQEQLAGLNQILKTPTHPKS